MKNYLYTALIFLMVFDSCSKISSQTDISDDSTIYNHTQISSLRTKGDRADDYHVTETDLQNFVVFRKLDGKSKG